MSRYNRENPDQQITHDWFDTKYVAKAPPNISGPGPNLLSCGLCGSPGRFESINHNGKTYWAAGCSNSGCRNSNRLCVPESLSQQAEANRWNRQWIQEPE